MTRKPRLAAVVRAMAAAWAAITLLLIATGCTLPGALAPAQTATALPRPQPATDLPPATPRTAMALAADSTHTPAPTDTLTATPTATPTMSPPPTATLTPTSTPTLAPTSTPTASPPPTNTPTDTPPPASRTPAPSATTRPTAPPASPTPAGYRFLPAGPPQPDPSHPCPGCPKAPAYIVGHVHSAGGEPLPGVRLVCYNEWHRYPVVATKGGGAYDFAIIQAQTTWYVAIVDAADRPISPTVPVAFNPQETCRYVLDWRRTD